jgi:hypothetical protein
LRSSHHNRKRKVGGTYDNNNAPSKLLCMAGDELKNDLAIILDVRSENLVETLTILLCKLNDTEVAMDESLTVDLATHSAEAAAASAAAVSATAVLVAAEAAAVSAAAVVTAAEVSASAAVTAAELLHQPPPVVYSNFTRPAPFLK